MQPFEIHPIRIVLGLSGGLALLARILLIVTYEEPVTHMTARKVLLWVADASLVVFLAALGFVALRWLTGRVG